MKICFHNGDQICATDSEFDVGLEGHVWVPAPLDYDPEKIYKLENSIVVEKGLVEYAPKRLRVHRVLGMSQDARFSDFSILGFRKIAPHYDRGRKVKAEYMCATKDEIIVRKTFSDVRDETTGQLTGLQVLFEWFSEDNTIGVTKTEIVKKYNKAQAETEERNRRERAIDFLVSEARYTENSQYIETLVTHYQTEITDFKNRGTLMFKNAILAESDPTILTILSARVPFTSDNLYTVPIKESILYQINALTESELMLTLQLSE